ncbi:MAG: ABC transporter substrate-binding protein [Burkholderiaceae bacterium]|nr:ABC transporter substrate-binding protein [Burkholderiaceae bacterium]MCD8564528.1 ABC transporter substrate-binding protein [Burkholderiaceae bacterium]
MKSKKLLLASIMAGLAVGTAQAQNANEVNLGVVTFLSGPAASPFGVPARNAAELLIQEFNAGTAPAPYNEKGFGGLPIKMTLIDEAGSSTSVVTEYRNLVQRDKVDLIVGYISSGNCLAIAPVAEELKTVTFLFDCGTPRIFEEGKKDYVFRAVNHATADSVGAALYLKATNPNVKNFGGINQNYAWGQDSWNDFSGAMKQLYPGIEVTTSQMPKLFAGQYSAEISALMGSKSDVVHTSFWGGDLEAFILQSAPRGLYNNSEVVLAAGETAMFRLKDRIPDGTIIGARGPYGVLAPDTPINRWFREKFIDRYNVAPNYTAYQMANSIMAAKLGYEKAMAANGGKKPSSDELAAAIRGMEYEGPGGVHKFALSNGHQAVSETAYGRTKLVNGEMTIVDILRFPAEKVMPPDGVKSADWIAGGMK